MEIPRDCGEGKGMETIVRSYPKSFGQLFQPCEGFPLCGMELCERPPRMGQRVFDSFLPYKKECLVPARDGKAAGWEESTIVEINPRYIFIIISNQLQILLSYFLRLDFFTHRSSSFVIL